MANFTEQDEFNTTVSRVETGDLVLGGDNGIINASLGALANRTRNLLNRLNTITNNNNETIFNFVYKVGSIYTNATDDRNPATIFGFGTWVAFGKGRVLVSIDTDIPQFDTIGKIGGERGVALTAAQNGRHSHGASQAGHSHTVDVTQPGPLDGGANGYALDNNDGSTQQRNTNGVSTAITIADSGNGEDHNNIQPYIVVYMWVRTE